MTSPAAYASSASWAQASEEAGWAAATSAGEAPPASSSRGSGSSGRCVGGGPPSRFSWIVMTTVCRAPACGPEHGSGGGLLELVARGTQLLGGLHDAGGHAGLGELAVAARVVGLLVADLAVDLQHTVVVA